MDEEVWISDVERANVNYFVDPEAFINVHLRTKDDEGITEYVNLIIEAIYMLQIKIASDNVPNSFVPRLMLSLFRGYGNECGRKYANVLDIPAGKYGIVTQEMNRFYKMNRSEKRRKENRLFCMVIRLRLRNMLDCCMRVLNEQGIGFADDKRKPLVVFTARRKASSRWSRNVFQT